VKTFKRTHLSAAACCLVALLGHTPSHALKPLSMSSVTPLTQTLYDNNAVSVLYASPHMTYTLVGSSTASGASYVEYQVSNNVPKGNTVAEDRANSAALVLSFGPGDVSTTDGTTSIFRLGTTVQLSATGTTVPPQARIYLDLPKGGVRVDSQAEATVHNGKLNFIQQPSIDFLVGTKDAVTGAAINTILPVLTIDNVLPGDSFNIRIYTSPYSYLERDAIPQSVIYSLNAVETARPAGFGKLTANVLVSGQDANIAAGNYEAVFDLVKISNGAITATYPISVVPVTITKPTALNEVALNTVPWQGTLPSAPAGSYTVQFRLRHTGGKGIELKTSDNGVSMWYDATNGYRYMLGNMTLDGSSTSGMAIGASTSTFPSYYDFDGATNSWIKKYGATTFGSSNGPLSVGFNMVRTNRGIPAWRTAIGSSVVDPDPNWYTSARWDRTHTPYVFNTSTVPMVTLDEWANYFYSATTPKKNRLLVNLWGSPYEASSDPQNDKNVFGQGGLGAPLTTAGTTAFKGFLGELLSATPDANGKLGHKNKMYALECSNEPDDPGFWSGTQTQLADACKAVYDQRAASGATNVPIICPEAGSPSTLNYVLSAKTTGGQPITQYCDMVGAHVYSGMARDTLGKPYAVHSLDEQLRQIRLVMNYFGAASKPLVITEYGFTTGDTALGAIALENMSESQRGDLLYQTAATMQENGVAAFTFYGYDVTGGGAPPSGFMLTINNGSSKSFSSTVVNRLKAAITDMGQQ
jgi:hypothetical protein